MNPLGVLTARDVMIDGASSGDQIEAEAPVKDIIDKVQSGATLQVMEEGKSIGQITPSSLLTRLAQRG
jgi:glycine betaine/proline transport system ATP-binding protein